MDERGWHGEPYRHSLAARGIKSRGISNKLTSENESSMTRIVTDTVYDYGLNWKLSENIFFHKPQSVILTEMSPEVFLSLSVGLMPTSGDPYHISLINRRIEMLKDLIASGTSMDVLYLNIEDGSTCGKTGCSIVGHNGRHRAMAALLLGIKKLPVAIFFHDCDDNLSDPESSLKVEDQKCLVLKDGHYRGVVNSEWRRGYVSSLDPNKPGRWTEIGGHPIEFDAVPIEIQWDKMPEAKEHFEEELEEGI